MWRTFRSAILLACALAIAADSSAARRRVRLAVEVKVPLTARWRGSGLLGRIESDILSQAQSRFKQFAYLDWITAGSGDVDVLLTIEEDPKSAPKAARPWVLQISRPSADPNAVQFPPIRFASAAEVHVLQDRNKPAEDVRDWFRAAMAKLENDVVANDFVMSVLWAIDVADDISPKEPNVMINVPKTDLNANELTRLRAYFRRKDARGESGPMIALTLKPATETMEPGKTECQVVPPVLTDYIAAVKNVDRKSRVSIFVSEYHRNPGSPRTGNTIETQR